MLHFYAGAPHTYNYKFYSIWQIEQWNLLYPNLLGPEVAGNSKLYSYCLNTLIDHKLATYVCLIEQSKSVCG